MDAAISPPPAARLDGWSRERLSGCSSRQSAPANEVPPNDDEQEAVADNPYSGPLLVSLSRSVVSVQVGEATLSSRALIPSIFPAEDAHSAVFVNIARCTASDRSRDATSSSSLLRRFS